MRCPKCLQGKIIEVESPDSPTFCWICTICLRELDQDEYKKLAEEEAEKRYGEQVCQHSFTCESLTCVANKSRR